MCLPHCSGSDPWSSEFSDTFVSLQLIPGQSLDWGEPLESGPDSEEFLRPPVDPTPAEKKVSLKECFFQGLSEPNIPVDISLYLIRCVFWNSTLFNR